MTTRQIKAGPFCWQAKAEMRRIADACDGRTDRALVIAIYVALTWLASDSQSESFTESKARIAERAGTSYRKAADVLAFLGRIGVVTITENILEGSKEHGPNTYTLGHSMPKVRQDMPEVRHGSKNGSVPRLLEESLEESPEEGKSRGKAKAPPALAEWLTYADSLRWPRSDANAAFDHYVACGWRQKGGNSIKDWQAAARNCHRRGQPAGGRPQTTETVRLGKNLRS